MSAERIERLRESMMRLHDEWVAEHGIGPTSDFIVKRIHAALRADEEAARQETPNPSAREAAEEWWSVEIRAERERQDALVAAGKFSMTCADPDEDPYRAIAVLVEEVGEVARATLEGDVAQTRRELIEVAAVAVAMVEGIDAREARDLLSGGDQ